MEVATIRKRKLSGWIRTWSAYLVHEDSYGMWLFTPADSQVHCTNGEDAWLETMGNGTEPGFLWLMPREQWWFGAWWRRPGDIHATYVDACTPSALVDGVWTWTDLELDVCRNDLNGTVWIDDEDEFEDSVAMGWIDQGAQRAARSITDDMLQRLTERVTPFDDLGWTRLDEVMRLGLPALELPTA